MHKKVDKRRDKTVKRIEMHKRVDKIRDATINRKIRLANYEKTDKRRRYTTNKKSVKIREEIMKNFTTDTGFDVVCASCMQYKSLTYCKSTSLLDAEQKSKFLVRQCKYLVTKYEGYYVCNICFQKIKTLDY